MFINEDNIFLNKALNNLIESTDSTFKFKSTQNYSQQLTILNGKTVLLNSVQESIKIKAWLRLTIFICLHNQLISIHSIVTYQRVQMSEKGDSSNR